MHEESVPGPDDGPEPGDLVDEHERADARPRSDARPDPLDRLWRHPSEIDRVGLGRQTRARLERPGLMLVGGVAVGGSMFGAVLTVAILALSGLLNGDPRPSANDRLITNAHDTATQIAAASVRPSVVSVTARDAAGVRRGSGVVVRHGGDILTSAWVVGGAVSVTIATNDKKSLVARVIGSDSASGLALLETDGDLPAASLAPHAPEQTSSVIALSGDGAIDNGIVNDVDVVATDSAGVTMPSLFVTHARPGRDAAGAPVIDGRAQVAGILLPGELGAVPIDYARAVAEAIRTNGAVDHAWIGISKGYDSTYGPQIRALAAAGPAALAGMQVGDVVLSVDGRTVASTTELMATIRWQWPTDVLKIMVSRAGHTVPLAVTAAIAPGQLDTAPPRRPTASTVSASTSTVPAATIASTSP